MKIPEEKSRVIGTVLILAVLALVFGAILTWMYSVNLLMIPDSIARFLGISANNGDGDLLIDTSLAGVIKAERPEDERSISYELSYENFRAALLSENEPEGFRLRMRVKYSSDAEEKLETQIESDEQDKNEFIDINFYRSGDKYRIERLDSQGNMIELAIFNSYSVYYHDYLTGASRSLPRSDDISPENEAGLPSAAELLEIVRQFPENNIDIDDPYDDEQEEIGDIDDSLEISPFAMRSDSSEELPRYSDGIVEMVSTELGNLYLVSYFDTFLGTREEYFLSLEYNVIVSHSIWLDETLIYSAELLEFSTDSAEWDKISLYEP